MTLLALTGAVVWVLLGTLLGCRMARALWVLLRNRFCGNPDERLVDELLRRHRLRRLKRPAYFEEDE